jgi:predicted RNA binding protein YcfA (HicA-like mRNA interferase family)
VKFGAFLNIISEQGFVLHRRGSGSHAIYRAVIDGQVRLVTVAAHKMSDEIAPGTLAAMIRQSGLPKAIFKPRS